MTPPEPAEVIALRYMTRFRCLGSDCEDTCCQRWNVTVDEAHFVALERLMAAPAERARFEAAFARKPATEATPYAFATIRMIGRVEGPVGGAAGVLERACPLLDGDGGCSVHRRHGEAALPDACSFYPRLVSDMGDHLELTGMLSCPEVVRLALVAPAEDDPLGLVEVEPALTGRAPVIQRLPPEGIGLHDELRGRLRMLLDREEDPLALRLQMAAWMGEAVSALFAEPLDDPEALYAALEEELDLATSDVLRDELVADRAVAGGTGPAPEGLLVLATRVVRLRSAVRDDFAAEIDRVLDDYAREGALVRGEGGVGLVVEEGFAAAFARRVARFSPAALAALDGWLARYAAHYAWALLPPSPSQLGTHVRELVVRLAALRFLVLSDPDGAAAMDEAVLRARFVRTVTLTTRLVDHGAELRRAFLDETEAVEGAALTGVLALL